jgi:uncharacterized protein YcbK (DUF882 family)
MIKFFDGTRRRFLQMGLATLALTAANPALAAIPRFKGKRELSFYNLHTDERLHVKFWENGRYNRAAWAKINHIMRDHYSGDVCTIDLRLLDLLYDLQAQLHNHDAIEIVSGYRSPATNLMLASMTDGVAKNSFHMRGMAIDLRMPTTPLPRIHNVALAMHRGGVGYYPDSQFVHIDVGPVRRWQTI